MYHPKNVTKHERTKKFKGWEFWDEEYPTLPAMLSKTSCSDICSSYPDLFTHLSDNYAKNRQLFGIKKKCALVTSSKIMDKYSYGSEIDSHDVVLRFNLHPIRDPKQEGNKTTHILVHCGFWNPFELQYEKLLLVQNRTENIILFFAIMHHQIKKGSLSKKYITEYLFPKYASFLKIRNKHLNKTFIINHEFIKRSRDAFEVSSNSSLTFYPSSGFMGLYLLARTCSSITAYGFSDSKLEDDYKFLHRVHTHDFKAEHYAMKRWSLLQNCSCNM